MSLIEASSAKKDRTSGSDGKTQSFETDGGQLTNQFQPHHSSGMTPSIITTINNTSPAPLNHSNNNSSESDNLNSKSPRRPSQPYYESYIEDSFVGHWEREDDDDEIDLDQEHGANSENRYGNSGHPHDTDNIMHPSTIEFDFDCFGPESFIYASGLAGPGPTPTTTLASASNLPTLTPYDEEEDEQQHDSVVEVTNLNTKQAGDHPETTCLYRDLETPTPREQQQQGDDNSPKSFEPNNIDRNFEPSPRDLHLPRASTWALLNDPNFANSVVDFSQIDLKVIEPYKKVISHAGYSHHIDPSFPPPIAGEQPPAIIIFSACYLPDRSRRDYDYVMDHLFLYVLSSLHELIADDYILIYLHNTQTSSASSKSSNFRNTSGIVTSQQGNSSSSVESGASPNVGQKVNNLPTFQWIKRCYQLIDRRLRKNLKILYLIKPTFWLKTIVIMCRPFISSKFSKKIRFVDDINTLRKCLPVDQLILPASAENL